MSNVIWVITSTGVPSVGVFGETRSLGSPIAINSATDTPYYLKNGVVTPIGSGGGTTPVSGGGTGVTSLTPYAPIFGGVISTDPVQSGTVGTLGHVLTSNGVGAIATFQALPGSTPPVVVAMVYPGKPLGSVLVLSYACPSSITTQSFAAAIAGSSGKALTAATAQTDLDVRKNATTSANGTSVGTIRFAAAGTVPTFIAAAPFTLTGGTDWLTVWAPATPDTTLADIAVSLYSTR